MIQDTLGVDYDKISEMLMLRDLGEMQANLMGPNSPEIPLPDSPLAWHRPQQIQIPSFRQTRDGLGRLGRPSSD